MFLSFSFAILHLKNTHSVIKHLIKYYTRQHTNKLLNISER